MSDGWAGDTGDTGPEVSIVIPTKDRPDDVRRAALCALDQRLAAVEVVVVDDGSQVPASEALLDVVAAAEGRLRIVRDEASGGVARARNRGVAAARAPWVGFCDDDDLWAPTKVRAHLDALAVSGGLDGPIGWSCSAAVKVDEDLRVIQQQDVPPPATIADRILGANVVPGGASSVIARTQLVRRLGGFDPAFSTLADWDLWVRLAAAAPLAVVDDALVAYVVQSDSMSADTALLADDLGRFHAKHRAERQARGVAFDRANWERYVGDMELRAGNRLGATRRYWAAVRAGRPSSWKLGVAALVNPQWALTHLQGRRRLHTAQDGVAAAESWLAAAIR
jgi:glycosyltransferase involved in cell wall biosynthesis